MWKGHKLYTVGNGRWVFDLTEYTGYRAEVNKNTGIVDRCTEAFKVVKGSNGEFEFKCSESVPVLVLKKVKKAVMVHEEKVGGMVEY